MFGLRYSLGFSLKRYGLYLAQYDTLSRLHLCERVEGRRLELEGAAGYPCPTQRQDSAISEIAQVWWEWAFHVNSLEPQLVSEREQCFNHFGLLIIHNLGTGQMTTITCSCSYAETEQSTWPESEIILSKDGKGFQVGQRVQERYLESSSA